MRLSETPGARPSRAMLPLNPERPPLAAELRRLAAVARGLVPDRRDPEAFHAAKSELEARLRQLARRIEKEAA